MLKILIFYKILFLFCDIPCNITQWLKKTHRVVPNGKKVKILQHNRLAANSCFRKTMKANNNCTNSFGGFNKIEEKEVLMELQLEAWKVFYA